MHRERNTKHEDSIVARFPFINDRGNADVLLVCLHDDGKGRRIVRDSDLKVIGKGGVGRAQRLIQRWSVRNRQAPPLE